MLYISSVQKQANVVWAAFITQQKVRDIERAQKISLRRILKEIYLSYEYALNNTNFPLLFK